MSKNYTPGPWRWVRAEFDYYHLLAGDELVIDESPAGPGFVVRDPDREPGSDTQHRFVDLTPDHPDARLIASAPDLLEACRTALFGLTEGSLIDANGDKIYTDEAQAILRAAIVKAVGETE
ncbi:MAG: hypothetical protein LC772_06865 [Chloroflexi bacterium]|nr:hypothetical protein [Chloroflexota bacterium]